MNAGGLQRIKVECKLALHHFIALIDIRMYELVLILFVEPFFHVKNDF